MTRKSESEKKIILTVGPEQKEVVRYGGLDWEVLVCAQRDVTDRFYVYISISDQLFTSFEQYFGEDDTIEHTMRRIMSHVNDARQDWAVKERSAILRSIDPRMKYHVAN